MEAKSLAHSSSFRKHLTDSGFIRDEIVDAKNRTHEFPEESLQQARKFMDVSVCPELVPALVHSQQKFRTLRDRERITYNSHFAMAKGLYLQVSIYQMESALGDQVMKNDYFAHAPILPMAIPIDGAPNFRRVGQSVLYGVAQPTETSVKKVVEYLVKQEAYNRVCWINLREEPVSYLNGIPHSPRDRETLNINLDHLIGIEGLDLEEMEQRLKADINYVASCNNNLYPIFKQTSEHKNEEFMINIERVLTAREIFTTLAVEDKLLVDYFRIPITDECAPEEKDFDELLGVMNKITSKTAVVFNCQMGRGRTTTGLVCAYLIMYTHSHLIEEQTDVKLPIMDGTNQNYEMGEWSVILKLVSLLEFGELIKYQVDQAIDACSQYQNLRKAIYDCYQKGKEGGPNGEKAIKVGLNYLERYWWLIVFNAYLLEQASIGYKKKFVSWMKDRWGLRKMLRKLELS